MWVPALYAVPSEWWNMQYIGFPVIISQSVLSQHFFLKLRCVHFLGFSMFQCKKERSERSKFWLLFISFCPLRLPLFTTYHSVPRSFFAPVSLPWIQSENLILSWLNAWFNKHSQSRKKKNEKKTPVITGYSLCTRLHDQVHKPFNQTFTSSSALPSL